MYPRRITFITNPRKCNLACPICFRNQAPLDWTSPEEMDISLVERVVTAFAPHGLKEIVPSTSGEPLLWKYMPQFCAIAHQHGLQINLTTNGTFPEKSVATWAALLLPVLSDIKISIMGASAYINEMLMEGIDHARHQANIAEFVQERDLYARSTQLTSAQWPTISLQVTVSNSNLDELPDLVHLAVKLGVDRIKFHPIWLLNGETSPCVSPLASPRGLQRWNHLAREIPKLATTLRTHHTRPLRIQGLDPYPIVRASRGACTFLRKEDWVWVDGSFQICPNPDARYGLRSAQPLGDFGNFAKEDPLALWHGAYAEFCARFPAHGLCQDCLMRKPAPPGKRGS